MNRTVAVTGASGLVGANLCAALLEAGHRVIATRRAGTRTSHVVDLGVEWREADLGDEAALTRAFAGCEAVFHCAAVVGVAKQASPEMTATNVAGTQRVIAACVGAGVARLVHTSSTVAIGLVTEDRASAPPCDETARWNFAEHDLADGYATTKRAAEEEVSAAVTRDKLDAVIVNPGYMFGPRDVRPSSGKLIVDVVRRRVPGWTTGYNSFVDVRDVVRGMIAAWQRGKRGERYILAGHNLTYRDIIERIARVAGVAPPRFGVPRPAAWLYGKYGDLALALGRRPIAASVEMRYAYTTRFRFSSAKAERELGYAIGPIEPAIEAAIGWFRANAML